MNPKTFAWTAIDNFIIWYLYSIFLNRNSVFKLNTFGFRRQMNFGYRHQHFKASAHDELSQYSTGIAVHGGSVKSCILILLWPDYI